MSEGTRFVTEETETGWRALLELTPEASLALKRADEEALAMRHLTVEPEHQFLALFGDRVGITAGVLADAGLTVGLVRELVQKRLGPGSGQAPEGRIPFSRAGMEAMDAASRVAFGVGSPQIGTEHLLLAMVALLKEGPVLQIIWELNVDPTVIRVGIKKSFEPPPGPGEDPQRPRVTGRSTGLGPMRPTHDWQ
ncbi:MAG: Clp protease N-terminal domain-containing protein [Solirubrobacteraceae bacterium]